MKQEFKDKIEEIYQEWLMEEHAIDIRCKDDLLRLAENRYEWDEFIKEIQEEC